MKSLQICDTCEEPNENLDVPYKATLILRDEKKAAKQKELKQIEILQQTANKNGILQPRHGNCRDYNPVDEHAIRLYNYPNNKVKRIRVYKTTFHGYGYGVQFVYQNGLESKWAGIQGNSTDSYATEIEVILDYYYNLYIHISFYLSL